jgi:hypothetical protein
MTTEFHPTHSRAREIHTLLLARGMWFSAYGIVEQINQALMDKSVRMTRLVGGSK